MLASLLHDCDCAYDLDTWCTTSRHEMSADVGHIDPEESTVKSDERLVTTQGLSIGAQQFILHDNKNHPIHVVLDGEYLPCSVGDVSSCALYYE